MGRRVCPLSVLGCGWRAKPAAAARRLQGGARVSRANLPTNITSCMKKAHQQQQTQHLSLPPTPTNAPVRPGPAGGTSLLPPAALARGAGCARIFISGARWGLRPNSRQRGSLGLRPISRGGRTALSPLTPPWRRQPPPPPSSSSF